jgi:hypothetical protein
LPTLITVCRVPTVFANFVQLISGRAPVPPVGAPAFVEEVRTPEVAVRDPRVVRLIATAWVLIAIKHAAIIWVVWHYHIPFHQLWINFPTWLLGLLATAVYFGRTRRA